MTTENQESRSPGELDPRKAAILEAIVTGYIGTAQPVGSAHIAQSAGIQVSPATVRSEMVAIERDGYLMQPHTSAGRIPTDKGYRFFVDHLSRPGVLGPQQRQRVSSFFTQVQGGIEDILESTSSLLSDLTSYAAVVVGPSHEQASIRSAQIVGLGGRRALVVAVLADGAVENPAIELPHELDETVLSAASAHLHAAIAGCALQDLGELGPSGSPEVDELCELALGSLRSIARGGEHEPVFVGGPSRLATAFDAIETVRGVLGILEQQLVVVSLLRDVMESGLSVAIGTEHGFEPLSSCAVVVAPLEINGRQAGAVGILGPTRMDYPSAMAAADVVGRGLSERIGAEPSGG